jgi:Domain of unknown function (DUF4157)/Xanthomonas XOO_2897-like deaminase
MRFSSPKPAPSARPESVARPSLLAPHLPSFALQAESPPPGKAFQVGGVPLLMKSDLAVGGIEDPEEHEADNFADEVMNRSSACSCGGTCASCGGGGAGVLRPKGGGEASSPRAGRQAPPSVSEALAAPGKPLDGQARGFMESRFGHDFSRVRVHDDARAGRSAVDVGARAYTVGSDVVFAPGRYAPGSHSGRHLLAHELAHVVQQGGRSGPLRRQPPDPSSPSADPAPATDPAPADAGVPGGAPQPAPAQPPTDSTTTPSTEPATETDPVRRIVVSCTKRMIAFETTGPPLVYERETCHIPKGHYTATISVDKNVVNLWANAGKDGELLFDFRYFVHKGQENPNVLLRTQHSVTVDVIDDIMPKDEDEETIPECQIAFDSQDLIPGKDFSTALFPDQSLDHTIWKERIPLGELGWFDVEAKAQGKATGTFSGGYDTATLSDICLFSVLSGGRFGGSGAFHLGGHLAAEVLLDGSLILSGEYLSFINIAEAKGLIHVSARAEADAAIDSALAVVYETGAKNPWTFKVDSDLSASAMLHFELTTAVIVSLLGHPIWEKDWNLLKAHADATWTGGLQVKPDLSIILQPGALSIGGEDSGGGVSTAAVKSGKGGKSRGGSKRGATYTVKKAIEKILDLLLADENADTKELEAGEVNSTLRSLYPPLVTADSPPGISGSDADKVMLDLVRARRLANTNLSPESFSRNFAVFKVSYKGGAPEYVIEANDPGELHSEVKIFRKLAARDRDLVNTNILQIYSERAPCISCAGYVQSRRRPDKLDFPVFYSITQNVDALPRYERGKKLYSMYVPAPATPSQGSNADNPPDAGP